MPRRIWRRRSPAFAECWTVPQASGETASLSGDALIVDSRGFAGSHRVPCRDRPVVVDRDRDASCAGLGADRTPEGRARRFRYVAQRPRAGGARQWDDLGVLDARMVQKAEPECAIASAGCRSSVGSPARCLGIRCCKRLDLAGRWARDVGMERVGLDLVGVRGQPSRRGGLDGVRQRQAAHRACRSERDIRMGRRGLEFVGDYPPSEWRVRRFRCR